jgi:hypothetical protein
VGRIKAMKTIDDWHKAGRLKGCEYKQISISPLPLKMENLFSEILKIEKPSNRSYVRSVPCVRAHGRTCVSVQRERREMRGRGYTAKKVPGRWTQIISRLATRLACVSLAPCQIMSSSVRTLSLLSRLSLALSYIVIILIFFRRPWKQDQRGRLHNSSTGAYSSVEREDANEEREKYDNDMKEITQQPS